MINLYSLLLAFCAVCCGVFSLAYANSFFSPSYWAMILLALVGLCLGVTAKRTTGRNVNLIVAIIGLFLVFMGRGFSQGL